MPVGALASSLRSLRATAGRPAVRAALLVFGLTLFVVLAVVSFRSLPDIESPAWWAFVMLIAVTTPATMALNAAEFRSIASTAGSHFSWMTSLETSLVASLANLLPVPGALAVRTTALMRDGASLRIAAGANLLAAGLWVACSCLVGGAALLIDGDTGMAVPIGLLAIAAVAIPLTMIRINALADPATAVQLLAIELATVGLSALRIFLAFEVVRQSVSVATAVVVSCGQVLAAIIGFVPGGLGLREGLAGLLAGAIGSDVGEAIAATVIDRVAAQIGVIVVILVLLVAPGGAGRRLIDQIRGRNQEEAQH